MPRRPRWRDFPRRDGLAKDRQSSHHVGWTSASTPKHHGTHRWHRPQMNVPHCRTRSHWCSTSRAGRLSFLPSPHHLPLASHARSRSFSMAVTFPDSSFLRRTRLCPQRDHRLAPSHQAFAANHDIAVRNSSDPARRLVPPSRPRTVARTECTSRSRHTLPKRHRGLDSIIIDVLKRCLQVGHCGLRRVRYRCCSFQRFSSLAARAPCSHPPATHSTVYGEPEDSSHLRRPCCRVGRTRFVAQRRHWFCLPCQNPQV